jgi:hypothetical protein
VALEPSGYLELSYAGAPANVQVAWSVVERLSAEAMRGFGVTRRRGTESGGLLLGRFGTNPATVFVDDYEPVPCEYAFGPSYVLSENDLAQFREVLSQHQSGAGKHLVVGFFRSHTRDGLGLDQADINLFGSYLTDPRQIVLLIKPFATRTPVAAVFYPRDGRLPLDQVAVEVLLGRPTAAASPPPALPPTPMPLKHVPVAVRTEESLPAEPEISAAPSPPRLPSPAEQKRSLVDILGPRIDARSNNEAVSPRRAEPEQRPMFAEFHSTPSL